MSMSAPPRTSEVHAGPPGGGIARAPSHVAGALPARLGLFERGSNSFQSLDELAWIPWGSVVDARQSPAASTPRGSRSH